jgi:hypothetical protein
MSPRLKVVFIFHLKLNLAIHPLMVFLSQVSYGVMREHVASLVKDVLGLSGETFYVGLHLL